MRSRLAAFVGVAFLTLLCAPRAQAEAILTVGGLSLVPDENGLIQLNVDVDLDEAAPNLVSFDLDVLHTGLSYVSHTIGGALDGDGDPLTTEHFDATLPDTGAARQNVLAILESGVGATVGRLFSMTLLVNDPSIASLSLLGFPVAELFEDVFRSESLVSEVAPLDLQAVPFIIMLTSNAPGQITMTLTSPGDPGGGPVTANEPATLLTLGLGLFAMTFVLRRANH
jgi:hypothetical protein